ncbi:ShlB/FhaC/HecB family hemolysin secretion/activation protein [Achromobacter seleniivolatilans]|uniref:ShlB/FhaC/HecB family hemolysin secretion/activation protein n=1 Tax=Achromobacter seleniivolatilans TaxID=3047478 RepID=A0ABY9LX64_9BURK|nr:ShlB/FhaC/HecB family hemolysin secretion/activation protein [Achromobacter sp. R39]WMD19075.1 ShlB/FhaC/HecB family hemolysin secretion/activation protein [Achromobacter sp. R39]
MREIESTLPALGPASSEPKLIVPSAEPSAGTSSDDDDSPRVRVAAFVISGVHVFDDATLQSLLRDLEQTDQDLDGLRAATARITDYYRRHGYLLARAYLPPQGVEDGKVKIIVLEGVYDGVAIDNNSRVQDSVLRRMLAPLKAGQAVHLEELDDRLARINDLPGLNIQGTLRPGSLPGSTELLLQAEPGPLISGSVDADNFGGYYTGEYRLSGSLNLNNPLRLGDQLNLRVLGSDKKQRYYHAAYQIPFGPSATKLGVSVSEMRYELGRDFSILEANGQARISTLFIQHPWLRGRSLSLQTQLQYEDKSMRDNMDVFGISNRKRIGLWTLSVNGTAEDAWLGGGRSAAYLSYSTGNLRFGDSNSRTGDRFYKRAAGAFSKANLTLLRLQNLPGPFLFHGLITGQLPSKNLDSSEQFSLGGPYGVRAFPNGAGSGDKGWQATAELRYMPAPGWQMAMFVDKGGVRINKRSWTRETSGVQLGAYGVSLTQAGPQHQITLTAAWPMQVRNYQPDGPKREPRMWLQATRIF